MARASRKRSGTAARGRGRTAPDRDSYWHAARTPIHSLVFLLPMVAFYEVGIIWVNRDHVHQIRNGGDVMLRRVVALAGRPGVAASALVLVAVLLLWQVISRRPWRVRAGVLARMLPESAVLGVVLYVFAMLYGGLRLQTAPQRPMPLVGQLAMCFGNGVYEELVFRLLLVGGLTLLFGKAMGLERTRAVWWAVGISALAFAVAHYVGPFADTQSAFWHSFIFRFIAGVFFSAVLAFRGFGIAAASHALYDVAVVLTE